MSTNGAVSAALRDALSRLLAENRALRAANRPRLTPAGFRHCRFCGLPVCGCGLEDYTDGHDEGKDER